MAKVIMEKRLYAKDVRGGIRVWEIVATDDFTLEISHGTLNGDLQTKVHWIEENQSGRDLFDQTMLEFNSRIKRQMDKGYVELLSDAMGKRTNTLGLPRPMLAQVFNKRASRVNYDNAYVQRKYDGNRCLIARVDGKNIAYTRNGIQIKTVNHILSVLDMPEGMILDGELYCHGESLQTIVSWIKRYQNDTQRLRYHIYDTVSTRPFADRMSIVKNIDIPSSAEIVPMIRVHKSGEANELLNEFRKEGYEGAMLRWGRNGYEDGKRSYSLLKMKEFLDSEFRVIDVEASKDGIAVLIMERQGKRFKATAPGTMSDKAFVLANKYNYIGRDVTIEYAYITEDGVPFHPIAKAFR